jgi:hypothetical protein
MASHDKAVEDAKRTAFSYAGDWGGEYQLKAFDSVSSTDL